MIHATYVQLLCDIYNVRIENYHLVNFAKPS